MSVKGVIFLRQDQVLPQSIPYDVFEIPNDPFHSFMIIFALSGAKSKYL